MDKQKALKGVNLLLGITFLSVALSGVFHSWIPYVLYRQVHPLAGFLLVILVVMHVYLNWAWIKLNFLK